MVVQLEYNEVQYDRKAVSAGANAKVVYSTTLSAREPLYLAAEAEYLYC